MQKKHEVNCANTLGKYLYYLHRWTAEGGQLRSITINLTVNGKELLSLMELRKFEKGFYIPKKDQVFSNLLMALRWSRGELFPSWGNVVRKLEVLVENIPPHRSDLESPINMINSLHEAFGGEFWIGGKLCLKDGKEVVQAFEHVNGQ